MGDIIAFLLVLLAIYLFIRYVLPILLAAGGVAAIVVAIIAGVMGSFLALGNYCRAIYRNINFLDWEWKKGAEPARRSYFFGPGYEQLKNTIVCAFSLNAASGAQMRAIAEKIRSAGDGGLLSILTWLGGMIFLIVAYLCIYVVGTVLCVALAVIHGTITTAIMVLYYLIFSVIWIIDRLYLQINRIRSDCPVCKKRFLVPTFQCPNCGAMHRKLVPGPYGIWKHKCQCGAKLPSTFMNGRSRLAAFCPSCDSPLVASDARPVVFQLVGGSSAGKTVYLAAFFHEFLSRLQLNPSLRVTIADDYLPYFQQLEDWFAGESCPPTAQMNSQMYPLLIDSQLGVRRQFSLYDIGGEMFDGTTAEGEIQQQQFHYCNGLLLLLDPFSSGELRRQRIANGEKLSDFSSMSVESVVENFINYMISTGHAKANERCSIPLAVLIAKSDVREVKRSIGPVKIRSIMNHNPDLYTSYEDARDQICRQFLIDIGMSSAVGNLETMFTTIHFFPVSAMGHSMDGTEYDPWGVGDAVDWMLPLADKELADLINTTPSMANA